MSMKPTAENFIRWIHEQDPNEIIDQCSWTTCAVGTFLSQTTPRITDWESTCRWTANLEHIVTPDVEDSQHEAQLDFTICGCATYADAQRITKELYDELPKTTS